MASYLFLGRKDSEPALLREKNENHPLAKWRWHRGPRAHHEINTVSDHCTDGLNDRRREHFETRLRILKMGKVRP